MPEQQENPYRSPESVNAPPTEVRKLPLLTRFGLAVLAAVGGAFSFYICMFACCGGGITLADGRNPAVIEILGLILAYASIPLSVVVALLCARRAYRGLLKLARRICDIDDP